MRQLSTLISVILLVACGSSDSSSGLPGASASPTNDTHNVPGSNSKIVDGSGTTVGYFLGFPGYTVGVNNYGMVMLLDGSIVHVDMLTGAFQITEQVYFSSSDCSGSSAYFPLINTTQPLMIKNRVVAAGNGSFYKVTGMNPTTVTAHSRQNHPSGGGCVSANVTMQTGFSVILQQTPTISDLSAFAPIGLAAP